MCQTRVADRVLDLQLDGHALDRHIVDAKLDANYHFMSVLESVVLDGRVHDFPMETLLIMLLLWKGSTNSPP